jgi:hypothetical protein
MPIIDTYQSCSKSIVTQNLEFFWYDYWDLYIISFQMINNSPFQRFLFKWPHFEVHHIGTLKSCKSSKFKMGTYEFMVDHCLHDVLCGVNINKKFIPSRVVQLKQINFCYTSIQKLITLTFIIAYFISTTQLAMHNVHGSWNLWKY